MSEGGVEGSMNETIRAAKAGFAKVEEERLRSFIQSRPDVAGPVTLTDLHYPTEGAGTSNGIAFFTAHIADAEPPRSMRLVLRYSPGVQLLKQKNFADEFKTLTAVGKTGLPVPGVLWLDDTGEHLGRVGYIMNAVEGDTPSAAMYSGGPLANISPEERKERMLKAAAFHGTLRAKRIGADQVPHLQARGDGKTAIEREVAWWFKEAVLANKENSEQLKTVTMLRDWLVKHQPMDIYPENLVHGDAQIANMIYSNGEVAAMIDWELSYLGHNESDLALICFITKSAHILDTPVEGTPTDEEYIARYEEVSGCKVEHWEYFKLLNMYRVMAVVSLGAYFIPQFDQVWGFYKGNMEEVLAEAKKVYGG